MIRVKLCKKLFWPCQHHFHIPLQVDVAKILHLLSVISVERLIQNLVIFQNIFVQFISSYDHFNVVVVLLVLLKRISYENIFNLYMREQDLTSVNSVMLPFHKLVIVKDIGWCYMKVVDHFLVTNVEKHLEDVAV